MGEIPKEPVPARVHGSKPAWIHAWSGANPATLLQNLHILTRFAKHLLIPYLAILRGSGRQCRFKDHCGIPPKEKSFLLFVACVCVCVPDLSPWIFRSRLRERLRWSWGLTGVAWKKNVSDYWLNYLLFQFGIKKYEEGFRLEAIIHVVSGLRVRT